MARKKKAAATVAAPAAVITPASGRVITGSPDDLLNVINSMPDDMIRVVFIEDRSVPSDGVDFKKGREYALPRASAARWARRGCVNVIV